MSEAEKEGRQTRNKRDRWSTQERKREGEKKQRKPNKGEGPEKVVRLVEEADR